MSVLIGIIIKTALNVLAGIGLARFSDRWLKPKVPANIYPEEVATGLSPFKIVALVLFIVVSIMIMGFIGKKLNIRILKNPCKR